MSGLDYSTVLIFSSIIVLLVGISMLLFLGPSFKGRQWPLLLGGIVVMAASGLTGIVPTNSTMEGVFWGSAFIASNILGLALIFSVMQMFLAIGAPIRRNLMIALIHGLAVIALYMFIPLVHGARTALYGFCLYFIVIPFLVQLRRSPSPLSYQRSFRVFWIIFLLIASIRTLFAFLDMGNDNFIPSKYDSWIILAFALVGIMGFTLCIPMAIVRQREMLNSGRRKKPRLSLSSRGLAEIEALYAIAFIRGKSVKQIALDYEVTESTVRNTLSHVYKKLGVPDKVGLMTLSIESEVDV
ncbi:MAG: LuxR C-terminal-related transcriptional regulator [Spirochaetota bacterium]